MSNKPKDQIERLADALERIAAALERLSPPVETQDFEDEGGGNGNGPP